MNYDTIEDNQMPFNDELSAAHQRIAQLEVQNRKAMDDHNEILVKYSNLTSSYRELEKSLENSSESTFDAASELSQLQGEHEKMKDKFRLLLNRYRESKEQIKQLQAMNQTDESGDHESCGKTISALQNQLRELMSNQKSVFDASQAELQRENAELKDQLLGMEKNQESKILTTNDNPIFDTLKASKDQIEELKLQLESSRQDVSSWKLKFEDTFNEKKASENEYRKVKKQAQESEEELKALVGMLREDLTRVTNQFIDKEEVNNALTKDLTAGKQMIDTLQVEISDRDLKLNCANETINTMENQVTELKNQIIELQKENQRIDILQAEVLNGATELKKAESTVESLQLQLSEGKIDFEKAQNHILAFQDEISNLNSKIKQLKDTSDSLQLELSHYIANLTEEKKMKDTLQIELSNAKDLISHQDRSISDLSLLNSEQKSKIEVLESEIHSNIVDLSEKEALLKRLAASKVEIECIRDEYETLKSHNISNERAQSCISNELMKKSNKMIQSESPENTNELSLNSDEFDRIECFRQILLELDILCNSMKEISEKDENFPENDYAKVMTTFLSCRQKLEGMFILIDENTEILQLKSRIEELRVEVCAEKDIVNRIAADKNELTSALAENNAELEALKKANAEFSNENKALLTQIDEISMNLNTKIEYLSEKEEYIRDICAENKKLDSQIAELKILNSDYEVKIDEFKLTIRNHIASIDELTVQRKNSGVQYEELLNNFKNAEEREKVLSVQNSALVAKCTELTVQSDALLAKVQEHLKEESSLKSQLSAVSKENQNVTVELKEIKTKLSASIDEISALKLEFKAEKLTLIRKIADLEQLSASIDKLENDNSTMCSTIEFMKAELFSLLKEYAEKSIELENFLQRFTFGENGSFESNFTQGVGFLRDIFGNISALKEQSLVWQQIIEKLEAEKMIQIGISMKLKEEISMLMSQVNEAKSSADRSSLQATEATKCERKAVEKLTQVLGLCSGLEDKLKESEKNGTALLKELAITREKGKYNNVELGMRKLAYLQRTDERILAFVKWKNAVLEIKMIEEKKLYEKELLKLCKRIEYFKAKFNQVSNPAAVDKDIQFEVLLRVLPPDFQEKEGNEGLVWCLVNYSRALIEEDINVESAQNLIMKRENITEWRRQYEIDQWVLSLTGGNENMLRGKIYPKAIQLVAEELLQQVNEKHRTEMNELKEELQQRNKTFNAYRARAHAAVKDATMKESEAQSVAAKAEANYSEEKQRRIAVESEKKSLEREYSTKLSQELANVTQLQNALDLAKEEISTLKNEIQVGIETGVREGVAQLQIEVERYEQEMSKKLMEISDLETRIENLNSELDKARSDAQKKGQLARKIIADKDEELRKLSKGTHLNDFGPSFDRYVQSKSIASEHGSNRQLKEMNDGHSVRGGVSPVRWQSESNGTERESFNAEEQILVAARVQAQRDEEGNRLRIQVKELSDKLIGKEKIIEKMVFDIEDLKRARAREEDLLGQDSMKKLQYLKNVVLNFISSDSSGRAQLVPVIATLLKLSENETSAVRSQITRGSTLSSSDSWYSIFGAGR